MVVTFIIVAYNAEKVMEKCLDSLNAQKYPHKQIEVILVDSSSTDNTKAIMQQFKKKYEEEYNRVLVLDNPKRTLPCGWNVALKEAKGEAVVRVDAHSTFPDNFIAEDVKELEKGENIVGGHRISVTSDDIQWQKTLLIAEQSLFGSGIAKYRRTNKREYVNTLAHAMYRKKVFDEVGLYNENLARTEDNEMHYRMKEAGYKFLLSPNVVSYHHARNSLKGMIKQKYGNGKWIGITMKYCPKCFSLYHFVPLFFILAIIVCIILAIFQINIPLYLLVGAYTVFNIINLILIIAKNRFHIQYLLLPFIFFILHCSYGIGTIVGLTKMIFMKKKK